MMKKLRGTIHRSINFSEVRLKATLLNMRAGVKKETLILLRVDLDLESMIPFKLRI